MINLGWPGDTLMYMAPKTIVGGDLQFFWTSVLEKFTDIKKPRPCSQNRLFDSGFQS
jgi:hypothetical protein